MCELFVSIECNVEDSDLVETAVFKLLNREHSHECGYGFGCTDLWIEYESLSEAKKGVSILINNINGINRLEIINCTIQYIVDGERIN